jgi:peptidyl-prolyl cis-trans isomerase B (cyclophilin B)
MAAITPDAIPDVTDVREGLAERFERWRVPILGGFALAVVGSLGLLTWSSIRREKEDALRTELYSILDDFQGHRMIYVFTGRELQPDAEAAAEQAKKLEDLRPRAAGSDIEPLLLASLALRRQVMGEDAKVITLVEELKAKFPDAPILQAQSLDSDRSSLMDRVAAVSKRRLEAASSRKFVEPKTDSSVSALVETDLGSMKLAFYKDLAPKHVEAFLQQARAGAFNGTKLYYARRGEWVEFGGGDRTRDADPRDDADDDDALALPPEPSTTLVKHRRRMVTSRPLLSGDQADRVAIVLAEKKPEFDAVRTPFGELLDDASAAIADRLGSQIVYGEDASYADRKEKTDFPYTPSRPVVVRRVSIWKEGALVPGHLWDTSRVNTDQPEPGQEKKEPEEPKKEEKPK